MILSVFSVTEVAEKCESVLLLSQLVLTNFDCSNARTEQHKNFLTRLFSM